MICMVWSERAVARSVLQHVHAHGGVIHGKVTIPPTRETKGLRGRQPCTRVTLRIARMLSLMCVGGVDESKGVQACEMLA